MTFLNHGSFGARPTAVQDHRDNLRTAFERNPVEFVEERLQPLLDETRRELAGFLDLDPDGLALLPNATTAVNTAIRAVTLRPGDEVLVTDHEYNACRNALEAAARPAAATIVVAPIPFPGATATGIVEAVLSRVTARTHLVLIDHVTSPTALVVPVHAIARQLPDRVRLIVDGAHAPGMVEEPAVPGADFIAGNCHKWLCASPGAAFLWVGERHRGGVNPLVISHGWNANRGRPRLFEMFDWTGTDDPTAILSIPEAIRVVGGFVAGGWPAIRRRNRELALEGRDLLCESLGTEPAASDDLIGSMATIELPDRGPRTAGSLLPDADASTVPGSTHPLTALLRRRCRVEVPILVFPRAPGRVLRISAHLYNDVDDYHALAEVLGRALT